ncbi:MAG: hypothetical protein JST65_16145 [Acidobacteria bacterium]|nr:hypothetical protein [Acidobacteriota bacterium]
MNVTHPLDQNGGVVVEVGGIENPAAARDAIKRIREYIRTMISLRKKLERVLVTRQQYAVIYAAATKKRDDAAPPRCWIAGGWGSVASGGR